MYGRQPTFPPAAPALAWTSRKAPTGPEKVAQELLKNTLEVTVSSVSWPRHADSPTSISSQGTFCSVASETELREALSFMRRFLHEKSQDISEKLKFLDCVDVLNSVILCDKNEGVVEGTYNPSLLRETLKFLLPETSSPVVEERLVALARISKLLCGITQHSVDKVMKDFKIGQVLGAFTLCCSDPCESVCNWAADALHRLYTLILHHKGKIMPKTSVEYLELRKEWEEEKVFWFAWFSDISNTVMIFKKLLRAEEQTDFILAAITGTRDDNIHNTKAASRMLRAILRNPVPVFTNAHKAVKSIYQSLEHISDAPARQEVFRYLRILGSSQPLEVVKTLLSCCVQCDSTASLMWHSLTCFSEPAEKILTALQSVLKEQPFVPDTPWYKTALMPLAATTALLELLKHLTPACRDALKALYPTLSIALLCQMCYTMHFKPQEIDIYLRNCTQQKNVPTPPLPFRSALRTFKALLRRLSSGEESLIMNKRQGSQLLLDATTYQKGISVFARAMVKNKAYAAIMPYLMDSLDGKGDMKHITVMTFLVELLRQGAFDEVTEEQIIGHLCQQLKSPRFELRVLALDGMFHLAAYPEKMMKLKIALPDILARLRDANREVNVKALKVLKCFLTILEGYEASSLALELSTSLLPLFDDASNKVRAAAISTFSCVFQLIQRADKESMKEITLQSLVPLMVHLQDESTGVTQVCWDTLQKADSFLKSFIQWPIHEKEPWPYCTRLVRRYREQGESILMEQAFAYLESPRKSLRDAAIRLLGK